MATSPDARAQQDQPAGHNFNNPHRHHERMRGEWQPTEQGRREVRLSIGEEVGEFVEARHNRHQTVSEAQHLRHREMSANGRQG